MTESAPKTIGASHHRLSSRHPQTHDSIKKTPKPDPPELPHLCPTLAHLQDISHNRLGRIVRAGWSGYYRFLLVRKRATEAAFTSAERSLDALMQLASFADGRNGSISFYMVSRTRIQLGLKEGKSMSALCRNTVSIDRYQSSPAGLRHTPQQQDRSSCHRG